MTNTRPSPAGAVQACAGTSSLATAANAPQAPIRIGTAGWTIPGAWRDAFVDSGALTEQSEVPVTPSDTRAAARHPREILRGNSPAWRSILLHRHHRRTTYERWAATVPPDFRFAVKLPRTITHELCLVAFWEAPLEVFRRRSAGSVIRL